MYNLDIVFPPCNSAMCTYYRSSPLLWFTWTNLIIKEMHYFIQSDDFIKQSVFPKYTFSLFHCWVKCYLVVIYSTNWSKICFFISLISVIISGWIFAELGQASCILILFCKRRHTEFSPGSNRWNENIRW